MTVRTARRIGPYYADDLVTIYHADCRDVLPHIDADTVDLLLTDPPYGIGFQADARRTHRGPNQGVKIEGDAEPFDPAPLLDYGRCVIWGANHFAHRLPPGGWVVWSKAQDNRWAYGTASTRSLAEVAWTNLHNHVALFNCFWAGSPLYRRSERGSNLHPNQKPVELMTWLIDRHTKPGDLVLDPYMGSGPIARACADLGRRYIGIELEKRYCEIVVQRLAQSALPFGGAS